MDMSSVAGRNREWNPGEAWRMLATEYVRHLGAGKWPRCYIEADEEAIRGVYLCFLARDALARGGVDICLNSGQGEICHGRIGKRNMADVDGHAARRVFAIYVRVAGENPWMQWTKVRFYNITIYTCMLKFKSDKL